MWKNLYKKGTKGTENGEILFDEEYKNSCRITLERCKKYYAITCGVYGAMVHTVFSDANNYQDLYDAIKKTCKSLLIRTLHMKRSLLFMKNLPRNIDVIF